MKPYLFEYHQLEDQLFLTEYIYEIGTFHYNWHKDLEILVVLKGEVEVCAGNRLYLLKEDDMIMINSNEGHATFSKTPESIAFLFRMNPDFLEQYIPDYRYVRFEFATDEISRYQACYTAMRRYMAEMMIAQIDEQGVDELLFRSAFYGLLNLLTKQFSRREDKNLLGVEKKPEDLSQILRYIEEHYKEKLTLDGVAEHFGYNSSYFSQMFRASVGINFYEFLTRRRLREAVRELDRTDKKILNISNDTGFPNLKSFNTRFKELFGRTPTQYRESLKNVRVRDSVNYVKHYIGLDDEEIRRKLQAYLSEERLSGDEVPHPNRNELNKLQLAEKEKKIKDITQKLVQLSRQIQELE